MKQLFTLVIAIVVLLVPSASSAITLDSKNDPFPVFTTLDPTLFLELHHRMVLKGLPDDRTGDEWFTFSVTPFGQNAFKARDQYNNLISLGNVNGAWDMIALLFGPTPAGQVFPPVLVAAQQTLFPNIPIGTPISQPQSIDSNHQFGFFDIPAAYRKRGLRFEWDFQIGCDVGFTAKAGIADIMQTVTFTNLTCNSSAVCPPGSFTNPNNPNLTVANVNATLMNLCNLEAIADQTHIDIENFDKFSAEDVQLGLYWRHAYLVNKGKKTWPEFLVIPFGALEGAIVVGKVPKANHPFALSWGSNGHNALGFRAGVEVDFTDTIEIGIEAGVSHFFPRCYKNMPMPTHECQSGIFPFQTDAKIQPGNNYNFCAKMFAYQFLERLSFHFQYVFIRHEDDCIRLLRPDPAFIPDVLEDISEWTVQVANIAFNYDISPYISLGFLWQAPLTQRNAFRSTTIEFGLNLTY